ncbi:unnamed protein product [Allacma fusca]|uniref:Spermine synthase n=1 Tax=Allacma fusca TaxID=39272 RepID=A0A8J2PTS8_9HEXA|nr:unnamed protein product [Allacma fusca]
MTISNDVGTRTIRYNGKSDFSGEFVVEDVICDSGQISRRLIFLNNPNVIQSDVALSVVKKKGKEKIIFKRVLACEHHQIMSIAFGLLSKLFKYDNVIDTLLVGLGGGLLAFFIVDVLPNIKLTAVEIDKEIVKVARDYFGLPKQLEGLDVLVDDGLKVIENTESLYNIILLDVDNKSVTEGLSCPPPAFLEEKALLQMKSKLNSEAGILVLNLVCRNVKLKTSYINLVTKLFPLVYSYQVGSDLNNILFCFVSIPPGTEKQRSGEIKGAIKWLDNVVASRAQRKQSKNQSQTNHSEWNSDAKQFFDEDVDFIEEQFKLLKIK